MRSHFKEEGGFWGRLGLAGSRADAEAGFLPPDSAVRSAPRVAVQGHGEPAQPAPPPPGPPAGPGPVPPTARGPPLPLKPRPYEPPAVTAAQQLPLNPGLAARARPRATRSREHASGRPEGPVRPAPWGQRASPGAGTPTPRGLRTRPTPGGKATRSQETLTCQPSISSKPWFKPKPGS